MKTLKKIAKAMSGYDRKILFVMAVFVALLFGNAKCFAEELLHRDDNVILKTTFCSDKLGRIISGICFGNDSVCVYSSSSYVIVDTKAQWRIVAAYEINHPNIRGDAPYVQQVIYENGTYYLLVFDHATRKSYIISQHKDQTKYGKAHAKEIRSFTLVDDGYFLTGIDETQHPWHGRMNATGDILWEVDSKCKSFTPVYCTTQDEHILIVSESLNEPSLSISILNDNGIELSSSEIRPSNADSASVYHVFQVDATSNDIAMCGELISNSECVGFFIRLNHDYSITEYQEYAQFMRIQSFVNINGQYTMLALTDGDSSLPYARYIISEATSSLYPLEKRDSLFRSIGLKKDNSSTIYTYGGMEKSVIAPDAFVAEMTIKE